MSRSQAGWVDARFCMVACYRATESESSRTVATESGSRQTGAAHGGNRPSRDSDLYAARAPRLLPPAGHVRVRRSDGPRPAQTPRSGRDGEVDLAAMPPLRAPQRAAIARL